MWLKLGTFYYLVRLARNPNQYRVIERFRALLIKHGYFQIALDHIRSFPENLRILHTRPHLELKPVNLNELAAYPTGTLGREYGSFMIENKLQPLHHSFDSKTSDEDYIHYRVVETHDIWHIVLGYGTAVNDEIKLQAFMLCQLRWPNSGFFVGGAILRQMFLKPKEISEILDAITTGWCEAKTYQPLLSVEWEKEWRTPVAELRARLKIGSPGK